jgi:hypothetical protein
VELIKFSVFPQATAIDFQELHPELKGVLKNIISKEV